jgi:S1-C subfamily serine protease
MNRDKQKIPFGLVRRCPASKAAIQSGDVITAVNGTLVKDARKLARTLGEMALKPR